MIMDRLLNEVSFTWCFIQPYKMNHLSQSLINIISVSPIPMAIVDREMHYLAVADKWTSFYGLINEPVIGRSHYELFPEIDERWKKIHSDCLKGKDQVCDEDWFERADGTVMWLKWEFRHWMDEDGQVGGIIMSSEDITYQTETRMYEKRFQLFMDDLPVPCWASDQNSILKYANQCFYNTFNLTDEVIEKKNAEIFGTEVAKYFRDNDESVLRSGKAMNFHQAIPTDQEHRQVFNIHKFPYNQSGSKLVGTVAFNITQSKHLEEELFQSETQFKLAFEHSPIGMALTGPDGKWKRVNKSLCQMLGYTAGELKKLKFQDLTHPDDLTISVLNLSDLASGKIDQLKHEKRYIHKNGSIIWVVIAVTTLFDRSGEPLYYVSQIEDITRRKRIENDLVLSEKKYRTIFENVQDVFYQTDPDGLVTEISPSIEKFSGFFRSEIIGRPVSDFYYDPKDRERVVESLHNNGFVMDFEVRLKTKNNELRYVSVNARLIIENGIVMTTDGSMRDVTARRLQENILKALNIELKASNEQKNILLSIIGHDLKNPISGSLQLLGMTLTDFESGASDEVQNNLLLIKEELSNANNLLEDLLDWARSQLNSISFSPVKITDLPGLINKCIQPISTMALKKKIGIVIQINE